eukprot:jgi/Botrbrau1/3189/Bobra.37_2s0019.1
MAQPLLQALLLLIPFLAAVARSMSINATALPDEEDMKAFRDSLSVSAVPSGLTPYENDNLRWYYKGSTTDITMDYSSAGYQLTPPNPKVTAANTVQCSNAKGDVAKINDAIKKLGSNVAEPTAVRLVGTCGIADGQTITITASNIFLVGSATSRASLKALGTKPRSLDNPMIRIGSTQDRVPVLTDVRTITKAYVPAGADTFPISGAALAAGTDVVVVKPLTKEWAAAMAWPVYDSTKTAKWDFSCSKSQAAPCPGSTSDQLIRNIYWERTVVSMSGGQVKLNAPISDNLDKTYGNAILARTNPNTGRIRNVGVMFIDGYAEKTITSGTSPGSGGERKNVFLSIDNAQNVWVSDVKAEGFNTGVFLGNGVRFATVQNVLLNNSRAGWPGKGARPLEFVTQGQQTLFRNCTSLTPGSFSFVTKYHAPGPNVFLRTSAFSAQPLSPPQPHMHWATGLLMDSARGAAPSFINRDNSDTGTLGGHGWAVGYSLIWNGDFTNPSATVCDKDPGRGASIQLEKPPIGRNMVLGSIPNANCRQIACYKKCTPDYGELASSPSGAFTPPSLYEAQRARSGLP